MPPSCDNGGMAILPVALLLALGLIVAIAWAASALVAGRALTRRQARTTVIALALGCIALWLGVSFVIYVLGGLTHSSHPFRDGLPWYLASFAVLVVAPAALILLSWRRLRQRRDGAG